MCEVLVEAVVESRLQLEGVLAKLNFMYICFWNWEGLVLYLENDAVREGWLKSTGGCVGILFQGMMVVELGRGAQCLAWVFHPP